MQQFSLSSGYSNDGNIDRGKSRIPQKAETELIVRLELMVLPRRGVRRGSL